MLKDLKRIGKHSIIYGLGGVTQKFIGFLMVPIYTRFLNPTDYGIIAMLMITTGLIGMLWNQAINSTLSRFYFNYKTNKDKNEVISTTLTIQTILSGFISFLIILFSKDISHLLFETTKYSTFINIIFITFFLQSVVEIPLNILRMEEKSVFYSLITALRIFVGLSFNIFFIVYLKVGLIGILLSSLIVSILLFILLIPEIIIDKGVKIYIKKAKHMIKFALPLIPGGLLMFILMRADVFLIQKLSTTANVGLYNLGTQFGNVLADLIEAPFFLIWYPFVFSSLNKKNMEDTFSRILTYFFSILIFLGLCFSVLINPIFPVIVGVNFISAYKIIPIIILAFTFRALFDFIETGLRVKKKTKFIPLIIGVGSIITIVLNLYLIPKFGFMGSAIAKLITFIILVIIIYMVSSKIYLMLPEKRIIILFLIAIIYYFISLTLPSGSTIQIILLDLILIATFPFSLYLLRFFRKNEIKKIKEIITKGKSLKISEIPSLFR